MKTYLQWRESFSAMSVMQSAKSDKDNLGNLAAEGLQEIVDALRTLAEKNPQSYNFIVAKIRSEMQKIDPSAGSAVSMGGRRYGTAVARSADNSQQQLGAT